jgi:hypothetical protein
LSCDLLALMWHVVFVASFVSVPVSTIPSTLSSDSNIVVTVASPDTSGVVRRQKNPVVCKYSSFAGVIPVLLYF